MSETTRTRRSNRISKSARPNYNLLDLSDKQLPPHLNGTCIPTKPAGRPKKPGINIIPRTTSPIEQNAGILQSLEISEVTVDKTIAINDNFPRSPASNETEAIVVESYSNSQIFESQGAVELVPELRFEDSEDETKAQNPLAQISEDILNEVIDIDSINQNSFDKIDLTTEESIQHVLPEQKRVHPFFTKFKPLLEKSNSENTKPKSPEPTVDTTPKPPPQTHPFFLSPQKKKELADNKKIEKVKEDECKRLELIKGMNRGKALNPFFSPTCRPKSSSPRPSTPTPSQVPTMSPLLPSKEQHVEHVTKQSIDLAEYPPLKRRNINPIQKPRNLSLSTQSIKPVKAQIEKEVFMLPELAEWWDDIIAPTNQLPLSPSSNQGTWSTKYTPRYSQDLQANFNTTRLLEVWLKRWKIKKSLTDQDNEYDEAFIYSSVEVNNDLEDDDFHTTSNRKKSKRKSKKNTARKKHKIHAGFPESDNVPYYWTTLENVMILEGPARSGKTSVVHACARSMEYQVVELHPGMLRSSKGVQQCIGEISKTHFVGRNGKSNVLIFINHADLLFPNDSNFWQSLHQIAQESKRPIILTSDPGLIIPNEYKFDIQDTLSLELMDSDTVVCQIQYIATRDRILLSKSDILSIVRFMNRDISKILNQLESICKLIQYQNLSQPSPNSNVQDALSKMEMDPTVDPIIYDYEGPMNNYIYINNLYETIKEDLLVYSDRKLNAIDSELTLDQYSEIFERNSEYDILKPSLNVEYQAYEPETCLKSHSLPHRIEEFESTSKSNNHATSHCIYPNYVSNSNDNANIWNAHTLSTHYDIINRITHSLDSQGPSSFVELGNLRYKLSQCYSFEDSKTRMNNSQWWSNFGSYMEPIITGQYNHRMPFGRGMRRSQLQFFDLNLNPEEELLLKSISPSYPSNSCNN